MKSCPTLNLVIVIPAYRPTASLLSVATHLSEFGFGLIVVDDGSGPDYAPLFDAVSSLETVEILRHPRNLGKGAALKTGIAHALNAYPNVEGIVTADADGQHHPEDIRAVAALWRQYPERLILGSRQFEGNVPLRSRLGNAITRSVVRLLAGQRLQDTQTGLRAIPAGFAASLLDLPSSGYEFELDMLIAARTNSIPVVETPIRTIYAPGNPSSHFNPVLDSMKIYFVLARFCSVALVTALIDNAVFYLVYGAGGELLTAQIAGRSAALTFNYTMVRDKVFRAKGNHRALARYLALLFASGAVSYICIRLVVDSTLAPVLPTKIVVESLLFFVNFAIEREWVFRGERIARAGI